MEEGVDAVRRLDAIVPNRLREDDSVIAAWEYARRVEYPSGHGKADARRLLRRTLPQCRLQR